MSGRNRKALLSDTEIEEIAQKVVEVLSDAGKDDADKDDTDKDDAGEDEAPASEHLEETLFSSDNRRTAMNVQNLIIASVATRSVFRRFAQLSDEEKEEVVKKVKEKMNIQDDEEDTDKDADVDTDKDISEDKPEEETEETTEQEDVGDDEEGDTNEDISEDTDEGEESDDDTEEVEEVPDESEEEPVEEEPIEETEEEPEPEEETEEVEEESEPEEQKEEIEEIVKGLVEEVQTIKQDGQVGPKDVLGLITNMMEMVNLLVQAKPPTRRRKRKSATREFEIAMKVAGYSYAIQPFALQLTGWQPVNVDVLRVIDRTWFDCEDEEGELHEGGGRMTGLNWKQIFPTSYLNYAQEQAMKKQGKAPIYVVRGRIPEGSAQNALDAISKALKKFNYDDVKVIG
jgi:hypothetical protein